VWRVTASAPDGGGYRTMSAMTVVTTFRTASASGGVPSRPANSRWAAPSRVGASVSTSASAEPVDAVFYELGEEGVEVGEVPVQHTEAGG
jgi:hypothetical protein